MILYDFIDVNEKGHLTFENHDVTVLAEQYGTPLMLLSGIQVRKMCRMYKDAFSKYFGSASVPLYASKALCMRDIYRIMMEEGMSVDCVSPGEIATAASVGFPMENVYFHGNNKTDRDISYAMDKGTGCFVVDNDEELRAVDRIAGDRNIKQHILLRITPGIDPHTHRKISTGSVDSKFGNAIETGDADRIVRDASECRNVILDGFHCHIGSQIFDIDPFVSAAEIMIEYIAHIRSEYGIVIKKLNLGGGYGVRYTEKDEKIDYVDNIRRIGEEIDTLCERFGIEKPDILMEPGRSVVAAAGMTVYECGSVKEIEGFRNYVSVDGGMTDNPRYTLYQSEYMFINASKADRPADFECTVAGRCCESGDLLGEGCRLARPERGDIIAVPVTGAYNYAMASNYNRIGRPPVVLIEKDGVRVSVRREEFEDMYRLES